MTELVLETPQGACRRSGCSVAEGGVECLLEHAELLDCPEFEPIEDQHEAPADKPGDSGPLDIRGRTPIASGRTDFVYPAVALSVQEAGVVLRERPATIVVPLGAVGVGKTTLLASIWEHICAASDTDGWMFAGSLSPYAFEDRCHFASFHSGATSSSTPHTPAGATQLLLHLVIDHADGVDSARDVLFADISGEHAANFVRANEPGPLLPLLRVADVVVLLVDGEQLASPSARWTALSDAQALLRVVTERVSLRSVARVVAVVTKWDKCATSPGITAVLGRLESDLSALLPSISLVRSAARSDSAEVPEGTGVVELLELMMALPDHRTNPAVAPMPSSRRFLEFTPGGRVLANFAAEAANDR